MKIAIAMSAITIGILCGCDKESKEATSDLSKLSPEQHAALKTANDDPLFAETDMGLWVRGQSISNIINSINTIPAANRAVSVQVTQQLDKLTDEADYYVELYDLPSNNAVGTIESIESAWQEDGRLTFNADLKVHGDARIHAHYKSLKVGGHMGFGLDAITKVTGQVIFVQSADTKRLFEANFELFPAPLRLDLHTAISDKKEWCWQIDLPFGGEAKDCKILWQYEIPINISYTHNIKTDKVISLPIEINLPKVIRLQRDVDGISFDKSIAVAIEPKGFRTDAVGLLMRVGVKVTETQAPVTTAAAQ